MDERRKQRALQEAERARVRQRGALTVVVHFEHAAPRHAVVMCPLGLPRLRGHTFLRLSCRTRPQASRSRPLKPGGHGPIPNTCRCGMESRGGVGGRVHADIVDAQDAHGTFCSIWAARCPPRPYPAPGFRPLPCPTPAEPPAHPGTHRLSRSCSAQLHAASHAIVALHGAQMLRHSRPARPHPAAGFRPLPFPPRAEPPVNVLPHKVDRSSCSQLSTMTDTSAVLQRTRGCAPGCLPLSAAWPACAAQDRPIRCAAGLWRLRGAHLIAWKG